MATIETRRAGYRKPSGRHYPPVLLDTYSQRAN